MNTAYTCGGCTACCTTHGVHSIQKQPRHECPSCTVGQGCTIYEHRPNECRHFACSWLLGKGGGPKCRPDITGIVPTHEIIPKAGVILSLFEYRPGSLHSELIFGWTKRNLFLGNFTAHHPLTGKIRFYLPLGEENQSEETRHSFEEYWEREVDLIYFESFLHNVVL